MAHSILALPTWLIGLLLVVIFPALVLLGLWGLRRRWSALAAGDHNDVVGFIIAVVGVIYAVLLAFVVIVAWENFTAAEGVVGQEASALRAIYRGSLAFPPQTRTRLHDLVLQYATEVSLREWPAMDRAEPGDPRVGDVLDEMARTMSTAPTTNPNQEQFVGAEAEELNQLVSLRSQRLDYVDKAIPGVLWIALIVGGIVTIAFAMLFALQRAALHSVMVGSLAALIGVLLFVTVVINYPFSGDVSVKHEPFDRVVSDFSH